MDKGFFSKTNVKNLLSGPLRSKFLLALPWTVSFAREQVDREREGIDSPEKEIFLGKEVLRGVSRRLDWPPMKGDRPVPVYVHIYYNLTKADERKNSLYGYAAGLVEPAQKDSADKRYIAEFRNYLTIKKSGKTGKERVSIRHEVLRNELRHAGWMVLISNHVRIPLRRSGFIGRKTLLRRGFSN
jgi:hypothetical protein